MNIVLSFSFPIVVFIFILQVFTVTSADIVLVDDNDSKMIPIDSDVSYQNITSIIINIDPYLLCDGAFFYDRIYPNTTFTIFPSNEGNGVTIETSPPNLVTVRTCIASKLSHCPDIYKDDDENNILEFDWNTDVSSTATSGGGVRIGVPSNQLKVVWVHDGYNVQIVDGFTNITEVTVEEDSILHASMTSLISTKLELTSYGGQLYVKTNVPVTWGNVYNGGQSWVETPSYNGDIFVRDDSKLSIKGDVDVRNSILGAEVSDDSQLTVTGTITGTIICDDDSIVNAPSCDNIDSSDDSTCNAGPQNVDVDVDVNDLSQNSQVLNGTCRCVDDGDAMFYSSSFTSLYICSSGGSTISFAIAIAFTTATAVVVTTAMLI